MNAEITGRRYTVALDRLVDTMMELYGATSDHMKLVPPSDMPPGGEKRWALRNLAECALVQVLTAADILGFSVEEVRTIVKEAMDKAVTVVESARATRRGGEPS